MNRSASFFLGGTLALVSFLLFAVRASASYNLPDPYEWIPQQMDPDTIPIEDRYGNWVEDPNDNPFDLLDPEEVIRDVEYDPITNTYILTEKIGNENYRPPTTMTYEEYLDYISHEEEADYFKQLAGAAAGDRSSSGHLDPVAEVDISEDIIDRLFGGTKVDIRPQGNVDLTFGFDYYRQDNPILPVRQQRRGPAFDFDMDIQVDVNGQIGEKLKTNFNYNTSRTFDFQNRLKLEYNADLFSEDEIIKTIEAGDVSLPLKSTLIQGGQALFGLKTALQFGHLRLTAIASQQNSEQNDLTIQGGSLLTEFEIFADEYDENRHFFLSHYNRDVFEDALKNLPQINSLFSITRLEVWVTNDRNQTTDIRDVVAIADLGEWEYMTNDRPEMWRNPDTIPLLDICMTNILPTNRTNFILPELHSSDSIRDVDNAVKVLTEEPFKFKSPRDFEKIQARKLNPSEYRYHPELGFISLNIRMDQDEVIGVAYEYTYNGKFYQVGELSQDIENSDTSGNQKVLFVKLLKGTSQRVDLPTWDLMMKNVYRIGGGDLNPEEFELDVFYEDPGLGFKRFLPDQANLSNVPLLNVFNLDKLNVTGDPQPDGRFDFITGLTINPSLGIVMFPVLEPFGSSLEKQILSNGGDTTRLIYHQLYDSTIVRAREYPELNRYTLKGKAKTSTSSDISLGAFNIPPGSVRVTAGGQVLKENEDYTIDYNIGRIKILNQAFLQPGTPINVSFEDNALFSFNKKTMLGLRADYEVNKNLSVGGTFMHLFERPYTQKVNIGDDPINNRIYGLDLNFSRESPWLTKVVDKIPLINTTAPSNVTFEAEVAALSPSHSRAIDKGNGDKEGVVYLDDFEGTTSNFDLRTPTTAWAYASTPQEAVIDGQDKFTESKKINDLAYGKNRAHINWYRIDQGVRGGSPGAGNNPYTRPVNQQEIFRYKTPRFGLNDFRTFDVRYLPDERGPYNFDVEPTEYSAGIDPNTCKLLEPETRWGGIMRAINQVNFEQANIEAIEFWLLDPFIDTMGGTGGKIVLQLGNISEDILRDSRKFFEHGLPLDSTEAPTDKTAWGRVPRIPATVNAFSNQPGAREVQDVGLDGLDDANERIYYQDYINELQNVNASPECIQMAQEDPSNDNFTYFLDENAFPPGSDLFTHYKKYNGTQGNSPPPEDGANEVQASTNIPDAEDVNADNSMSENESYYEYVIQLDEDPLGNDEDGNVNENTPGVTDVVRTPNGTWYRFKIPLDKYTRAVNGISDFRSIRFIRMFLTQWERPTTLRFATLDLVRNQWRRVQRETLCGNEGSTDLIVDAVNIEEHTDREPFAYDIPLGIQRERITSSTFQDVFQNEQSLSLRFSQLTDGCNRAVYKNLDLDLRVFKKVQMFVHAEEADSTQAELSIPHGAVKLFLRFGSDFESNYYEYELPLVQSKNWQLDGEAYKLELWRPENEVNFALEEFTNLKIERNQNLIPLIVPYEKVVTQIINGLPVERKFTVKGNPTLGYVRNVVIGVRNAEGDEFTQPYYGEVWVNELRLVGLEEKGGVAGLARLDADLADFGSVGVSGTYSSIGWGAIDQKLDERSKESITQMDISTNLQLGKFFGEDSKIQIPFYYQYSQSIRRPKYDALDLDLLLKEKLERTNDQHIKDSVRNQSIDFSSLSQFSFTNVRKERTGQGAPKPWDISNFTTSFSFSRSLLHNEIVEKDQLDQFRASLDWSYSIPIKPLQPFKNVSKSKWMLWLTEFNLNPIPGSYTFGTVMDRKFGERAYRFSDEIFKRWFDKRFIWETNYSIRWDLTKAVKINFSAINNSVIDEPDEYVSRSPVPIRIEPRERKDSIWQNIKKFGRTKDYAHNLRVTWSVPFKFIPILDWVRTDVSVDANYSWHAASINTDSLGNVIQNGQDRQISADLDFVKLYGKIPLLAQINKPGNSNNSNKSGGTSGGTGGQGKTGNPNQKKGDPKNNTNPQDNQGLKNDTQKDSQEPKDNKNQKGDPAGNVNPDPKNQSKEEKKQSKADKKAGKVQQDKDTKKPSEVDPTLKAILRPLMAVRKLKLNYGNRVGTTVPGFRPQSGLLGMSKGFEAPGWDFIAGMQPQINRRQEQDTGDWLADARSKEWITTNPFQNAPVIQTSSEGADGKLTLEPFTDFKIDVDASRNLTNNFSEYFKTFRKGETSYDSIGRASPREIGSFTMTYLSIPTLFMDDSLQLNQLFDQFQANRAIISNQRGDGTHDKDGVEYAYGFGRKQQDILVPAFLSAYTNKDPENFELTDMFHWFPRPNWTLSYNGLSKLPWFKDIFSNIRITHGYKGVLSVNSFESDLSYDDYDEENDLIVGQRNEMNFDTIYRNYYSQFLLPSIIIEEGFTPLIGFDIKFQNEMNVSFAYTKKRSLAMRFISYELEEVRSTTLDFGLDWTLKDVRIGFLPGFNSAANKKKSSSNKEEDKSNVKRGNDLDILFDLSFSDNLTINHLLDQKVGARPTRGSKDISISPSIRYDINKNVNLRFFVDFRKQEPYVSSSYKVVTTEGGVTVRVSLE